MKNTIINSYYGGIQFLERRMEDALTIFIVDDQEFYSSMLKQKLEENENFAVFTFHTGEACLEYLDLEPDLVIIDYHLDGTFKAAKKGDEIAELIERRCPDAKTIIVSADHKISLLKELGTKSEKIHYKHGSANQEIEKNTIAMIARRRSIFNAKFAVLTGMIVLSYFLVVMNS